MLSTYMSLWSNLKPKDTCLVLKLWDFDCAQKIAFLFLFRLKILITTNFKKINKTAKVLNPHQTVIIHIRTNCFVFFFLNVQPHFLYFSSSSEKKKITLLKFNCNIINKKLPVNTIVAYIFRSMKYTFQEQTFVIWNQFLLRPIGIFTVNLFFLSG